MAVPKIAVVLQIVAVPTEWDRRKGKQVWLVKACFQSNRSRERPCGYGKGSSNRDREPGQGTRQGFGLYVSKRERLVPRWFCTCER